MALAFWLCGAVVNAAPVNESAALQQAQAFLSGRGRVCVLEAVAHAPERTGQTDAPQAYHIFNVANGGGYVVVSGDDRAVPVLGYADSGYLDPENLPEGLQELLDGYAEEIGGLDGTNGTNGTNETYRLPVLPLVETMWGQSGATNLYTPIVQSGSSTKHASAGCNATAMAMIMYYHRWPNATTKTIPGYYCSMCQQWLDSLPVTTLDYNIMQKRYTSQSDSASMREVSKMMLYAGYSIQSEYDWSGTSAYLSDVAAAMVTYFDFDSSTVYVMRKNYSYEGWVELLYNELAEGRPILYAGQRTGGGHTFVCDGYDTEDYFHFNFGWSGDSNGYYRVSALSPNSIRGGSRFADGGYAHEHRAVIGARPNTGAPMPWAPIRLDQFTFRDDTTHVKVYHRNSENEIFQGIQLMLKVAPIDLVTDTIYYEYIAKVYDLATDEVVDTLFWNTSGTLYAVPGYVYTRWHSFGWWPNPGSGQYVVRFLARLRGTEEWKNCVYNDQYYLTAKVDSLTLTIRAQRTLPVTPYVLDMASRGPHAVGLEDTVRVRLVALDGDCRADRLFLTVQRNGEYYDVSSQHAYALMGDTTTVEFTYKPSQVGVDTLCLFNINDWIEPLDTTGFDGSIRVTITATPTDTKVTVSEQQATAEDKAWYTLTGIRLGTKPTLPGAYIHNRKVEIVR